MGKLKGARVIAADVCILLIQLLQGCLTGESRKLVASRPMLRSRTPSPILIPTPLEHDWLRNSCTATTAAGDVRMAWKG